MTDVADADEDDEEEEDEADQEEAEMTGHGNFQREKAQSEYDKNTIQPGTQHQQSDLQGPVPVKQVRLVLPMVEVLFSMSRGVV